MQGMWNAQVKDQLTEMHRLKVNGHCDTALQGYTSIATWEFIWSKRPILSNSQYKHSVFIVIMTFGVSAKDLQSPKIQNTSESFKIVFVYSILEWDTYHSTALFPLITLLV